MKARTVKFILALSALTVLDWAFVEFFLIGEFLNNRAVSIIWGIVCLVISCGYSLWRCPLDFNAKHKEDKPCP